MTTYSFLRAVFAFFVLVGSLPPLRAENIQASEKAKIERLIGHVESLSAARFIRNGNEYDAKSAAEFLRQKWKAHEAEIHTAQDFITKAASVSSTSGKPYLIRLKDGKEMKCGDYLTAKLKEM